MRELTRYTTPISDSDRWRRFAHRPGDIVISVPPKCGTTWMQMLCGLLIFDGPAFPAPLGDVSPWLDMLTRSEDAVFGLLAKQSHRRFIKTHTPLDGLPLRDDVTYLLVGRDPRDVLVSFEHHLENHDFEKLGATVAEATGTMLEVPPKPTDDPAARFRAFAEGPPDAFPPTLAALLHYFRTGWDLRTQPNVALFHFADLRSQLVEEMARLADVLDLTFDRSRLTELAAEAEFERMRERADELVPDASMKHWRDLRGFFRSGGSGEWRARASDADREAYDRRVAELVPPDLAAWAHHGRSLTPVDAEIA